MDGAPDGSSSDNYDNKFFTYIYSRHGLHYYYLC